MLYKTAFFLLGSQSIVVQKRLAIPLTNAQIKSFRPAEKRFRHSDGGGLFIEVMPSGKKIFRLAYRISGKQRTAWIGDYPATGLADARLKVAELKLALRSGSDPKDVVDKANRRKGSDPASVDHCWRDIANDYLMLRQRSGAAPRTVQTLTRQLGTTITAYEHRSIVQPHFYGPFLSRVSGTGGRILSA